MLVAETMDWLAIKPSGLYVDATVGLGGHSIEIARRLGAGGRLLGLDRDAQALGLVNAPDAASKARMVIAYFQGLLTECRIKNDLAPLREGLNGIFELVGVKRSQAVPA